MTLAIGRRDFLRRGACLAAMGTSGCGASTDTAEAYEPWRSWTAGRESGPRRLVNAAILAANAHDTQPWIFCFTDSGIILFADERRNLGAMDPFRREMHISLGCALENLALAARAQGYEPLIEVAEGVLEEPRGAATPRQVAAIQLRPGTPDVSPQFRAIASRHTNRGPYERDRAVPADMLGRLSALADQEPDLRLVLLSDAGEREAFATATSNATAAIIADAAMIADSDAWFRASDLEIALHRDGPTIASAGLSPWVTFFANILPAPSPERAHRIWLDQTKDVQLATAPLFGLIAVRDLYDGRQAVATGRLWQRLHLEGTNMGLAMQPLNQVPEMVDRERQLGKPPQTAAAAAALMPEPAWRPTFAFRAGWPVRSAPPSPRRDLDQVISAADAIAR